MSIKCMYAQRRILLSIRRAVRVMARRSLGREQYLSSHTHLQDQRNYYKGGIYMHVYIHM